MRQMYDAAYMAHAMSLLKEGKPFWVPHDRWYFAAQREYHEEDCPGTRFSVKPLLVNNSLILMPDLAKLVAIDFKKPWPQLIMLKHAGHCVWNWPVKKHKDAKEQILRIDLRPFESKPIVTINNIGAERTALLRRNWYGT